MKAMKMNKLVMLLVFLFAMGLTQAEDFTKTMKKSFEVNPDALLVVKNKFGKVECTNTEENKIFIEVEISIDTRNEEKAGKFFNSVNVELSGDKNQVSAITHFEGKIKNGNDNFSVDYKISFPESISLDADIKFGDLILENVEGSANIDLSYGNIKARRLTGPDNSFDIKFSDGEIGYLSDAELNVQYSDIEISEARSLNADTKFSDLEIGNVEAFTLESGYDDQNIGAVRHLDVEASFSDIEVRSVADRLIADFDYGEFQVKEIKKNFSSIDLKVDFADAKLGFNMGASYQMHAIVKMGDLNYPKDKSNFTMVDLSSTNYELKGLVGDDQGTGSKVEVECKNADVTLYYR